MLNWKWRAKQNHWRRNERLKNKHRHFLSLIQSQFIFAKMRLSRHTTDYMVEKLIVSVIPSVIMFLLVPTVFVLSIQILSLNKKNFFIKYFFHQKSWFFRKLENGKSQLRCWFECSKSFIRWQHFGRIEWIWVG